MLDLWAAVALSVLAAATVVIIITVVRRRHVRSLAHFDQPFPYDDKFNRRTVTTTLDWYILRHLQDQRLLPIRQTFLDEDRHHNAILNHYAAHLMKKQNRSVVPAPSTVTESVRARDVARYVPQYFPDEDLDDALPLVKHELIARRLVSTIGYLQRIAKNRGEPLVSFEELKPGCTPFVREAYTTFYNDLVSEADAFNHEPGLRDKLRVLAVRMVFPARDKEFNYWKEHGLRTLQVPTPLARDAIEGWFYLDLKDVPVAETKRT